MIPLLLTIFILAACGARTGLNVPDPVDASTDACVLNSGSRCAQTANQIARGDQFFRQPAQAQASLLTQFPGLPGRLTDTHFAPALGNINTYVQYNRLLIAGGCVRGTTNNIPFLLFYYLNADGSVRYSDFRDTVFGNVGVYAGGPPEDTGDYHLNAAIPGVGCTELHCITAMMLSGSQLCVADTSNNGIACYDLNSPVRVERGDLCH